MAVLNNKIKTQQETIEHQKDKIIELQNKLRNEQRTVATTSSQTENTYNNYDIITHKYNNNNNKESEDMRRQIDMLTINNQQLIGNSISKLIF